MHKTSLLLFVLLTVASTVTLAQWFGNNNNNGQNGFPSLDSSGFPSNYPSVDCSSPGVKCQSVSVKCDSSGNCKQMKNSATTFSGVAVTLFMSVGTYVAINYLRF